MVIEYQKVMSSSKAKKQRSTKSISCASACVFEILHYVPLDKMKAYFYFETAS